MLVYCSPGAFAATIVRAEVDYERPVYRVEFEVVVEGEYREVRRLLTDYEKFADLSPTVEHSAVLETTPDGRTRVEVILRPCFLVVFCRRIRKVTDSHTTEAGEVVHTTVPALSDFHRAHERLSIAADGPRATRIGYRAELVPKFRAPPIIGPWIIRRQIMRELTITSDRVENLTRKP